MIVPIHFFSEMITSMRINSHCSNKAYNVDNFTKKIISTVKADYFFMLTRF